MAEHADDDARPNDSFGRALYLVCVALAIFGGFLACGTAALVVVSVTGRYLIASPVPGDYDLVGIISGCAVFAFLPYCQIQEGNVIVDLFTAKASPGVIRFLSALGDLAFLVITTLICWRLIHGCIDYMEYDEVTMVLKIPIWWAMPPIIASFALLTLACASTLLAHIFGGRK